MPIYADYRFSEESGSVALNLSGSHGTYQGSPTLQTLGPGGQYRYAAQFNGSSQWVDIPRPAAFTTVYQIQAWVKLSPGSGNTRQCVFDGRDAAGDGLALFVDGDSFRLDHNGTVVDAGTTVDADGGWRFVIAGYNANTAVIRVNDFKTNKASATSQTNIALTTANWAIGKDKLDNDDYLNGQLAFLEASNESYGNVGYADIRYDRARPYFTIYPKIVGTNVVGQTLSVSWAATGQNSYTAAYAWVRYNANGTTTTVGTGSTYTIQAGDAGAAIGCDVTLTDIDGAGLSSFTESAVLPNPVFEFGMPYIAEYQISPFEGDYGGGGSGIHPVTLPHFEAGDLVVCFVTSWAAVGAENSNAFGWTYAGPIGNGETISVFYKRMNGTESRRTRFATGNSYYGLQGFALTIRGAADPADRSPTWALPTGNTRDGTGKVTANVATVNHANSLAIFAHLNMSSSENFTTTIGINDATNLWRRAGVGDLACTVRFAYIPTGLPAGNTPTTVTVTNIPTWMNACMGTLVIPPAAESGSLILWRPQLGMPLMAVQPPGKPAVTGVLQWWDAADISKLTLVDGKVSALASSSGNSRLEQTSSTKRATITYVNNLLALTFADAEYEAISPGAITGTTLGAIVVASVASSSNPSGRLVSLRNSSRSNDFTTEDSCIPLYRYASAQQIANYRVNLGPIVNVTYNQLYVMGSVFDGATKGLWVNGTASATNASTGNFNADQLWIGQSLSSGDENWHGTVCEIILFNDVSTANRQTIEGYLAHKWGLAASLPAGHPYKDNPPPTSGGGHSLTANSLSSGTPVLDSPALTQEHSLTASALTSGPPVLDSPALTQVHVLTPTALSSGAPVLDSPALGQPGSLTANPLSAGTPTLGTPALSQTHVSTATSLSAGTPTLGSPSLSQTHVVTASALSGSAPTLASPSLSQTHVLTPTALTGGTPQLASPTLGISGVMIPNGLSAGEPTLGSPALSQVHALGTDGVAAGSPTLGSPTLSQTHLLSVSAFSAGAPTLGRPLLNWDQIPYVPSYLRTYYPPVSLPERTALQLSFGNRTFPQLDHYARTFYPEPYLTRAFLQLPYGTRTGIPNGS